MEKKMIAFIITLGASIGFSWWLISEVNRTMQEINAYQWFWVALGIISFFFIIWWSLRFAFCNIFHTKNWDWSDSAAAITPGIADPGSVSLYCCPKCGRKNFEDILNRLG